MYVKTLRVSKIRNGTVIDHISRGHALDVVKILGIDGRSSGIVTIAMNVPSGKLAIKDIIKIEGRELNPEEVDRIALISPHASINIVRNYKVTDKQTVKLQSVVRGIVKCNKPSCISNDKREPVGSIFYVKQDEPLKLRCHYCNNIIESDDILKQF